MIYYSRRIPFEIVNLMWVLRELCPDFQARNVEILIKM